MKLIADSGSTSTTWILLDNDIVARGDTGGFNPYFMKPDVLDIILSKELSQDIAGADVKEIYYYGSGCSTEKKFMIVCT